MLDTLSAVSLLTIMEVAGPIILAAALIYGIFRSQRRRRRGEPRTTAGTVYAQDK
jgi:hypothetical protein